MTPNEWSRYSQATQAAQARCSECGASKAGLHESGCQVALAEVRDYRPARKSVLARFRRWIARLLRSKA